MLPNTGIPGRTAPLSSVLVLHTANTISARSVADNTPQQGKRQNKPAGATGGRLALLPLRDPCHHRCPAPIHHHHPLPCMVREVGAGRVNGGHNREDGGRYIKRWLGQNDGIPYVNSTCSGPRGRGGRCCKWGPLQASKAGV